MSVAFLRHFTELALLKGSGGTIPIEGGRGEVLW